MRVDQVNHDDGKDDDKQQEQKRLDVLILIRTAALIGEVGAELSGEGITRLSRTAGGRKPYHLINAAAAGNNDITDESEGRVLRLIQDAADRQLIDIAAQGKVGIAEAGGRNKVADAGHDFIQITGQSFISSSNKKYKTKPQTKVCGRNTKANIASDSKCA